MAGTEATDLRVSESTQTHGSVMGRSEDDTLLQGKRKRNTATKYRSYESAQAFAASLQLRSRKEWREYVKGLQAGKAIKPEDVPSHPDGIYKTKGWQGWRQWLGTERPLSLN